jgi:uncharacterized protein YmfQ (DUF2313 family)
MAPGLLAWLFGSAPTPPSGIFVRVSTNAPLPPCTQVGLTLVASYDGYLPPIDGVVLHVGDRVLVRCELDPSRNGIYVVTSIGGPTSRWVLTRASDMDEASEFVAGMQITATEGWHAGTWVLLGTGPWVVGVSPVLFGPLPLPLSVVDRVRSLIQLLPPGKLWRLEPTNVLYKVLAAIAEELERVRARYDQLMLEVDPRTATETIAEWERSLSLPDEVIPVLPTDLASRRVVVAQKWVALGGQSYSFFAALCAQCGYPLVSVAPGGTMLRVGFRVGARCYAQAWGYTVVITVGPAGVGALTHTQLEAVLRAAVHAHLSLIVVYT